MALGGLVLGSPILYLKDMRILMFQLSGFYYILKAPVLNPYSILIDHFKESLERNPIPITKAPTLNELLSILGARVVGSSAALKL